MADWLKPHIKPSKDESVDTVPKVADVKPLLEAEPIAIGSDSERLTGPHLERKLLAERLERERLERKTKRKVKPAEKVLSDQSKVGEAREARAKRRAKREYGLDDENRKLIAKAELRNK